MDHLFPQGIGDDVEEDADGDLAEDIPEHAWVAVPARETGYIQRIDGDALLVVARERGVLVRMECGIGEFVVEGAPLISVASPAGFDKDTADEFNAVYVVS